MVTSISEQLQGLADNVGFLMTVPALKGWMGSVDYYVITLPFSTMARYITTTDPNLPAKQRENRRAG